MKEPGQAKISAWVPEEPGEAKEALIALAEIQLRRPAHKFMQASIAAWQLRDGLITGDRGKVMSALYGRLEEEVRQIVRGNDQENQ